MASWSRESPKDREREDERDRQGLMKIEEEGDDDVDAYDDSTMVGNWAVSAIGQRKKQ